MWGLAAAVVAILGMLAVPAVVNATAPAAEPYVRPSDAFGTAEPAPTTDAVAAVGPEGSTLAADFRAGDLTAQTGQPLTFTGGNPLVADGGGMTIAGTGAGYTFAVLDTPVQRFGATVTIDDGDPDAVVAMIVSAGPTDLDLGNMGVHYIFDSEGWAFQVRESGEEPFPLIASGKWAAPIVKDGATEYQVELTINGDTVTVRHIDGTVTEVTDPRIAANLSGVVAWEVLRPTDQNERPVFRAIWAS